METGEVSFTKQVKSELSARSYTTEEKKSLLSGFIRNGAVFSIGSKPSLELRTEIASVCKLIYSSLKDVYQRTPRITYEKKTRFKKGVIYRISVRDKRLYDRREELEVFKDGIERIPPKNRLHRKNLSSFLIGCFLANGSVNNPSSAHTSYYLEMAFTDKNDALAVKRNMNILKKRLRDILESQLELVDDIERIDEIIRGYKGMETALVINFKLLREYEE